MDISNSVFGHKLKCGAYMNTFKRCTRPHLITLRVTFICSLPVRWVYDNVTSSHLPWSGCLLQCGVRLIPSQHLLLRALLSRTVPCDVGSRLSMAREGGVSAQYYFFNMTRTTTVTWQCVSQTEQEIDRRDNGGSTTTEHHRHGSLWAQIMF